MRVFYFRGVILSILLVFKNSYLTFKGIFPNKPRLYFSLILNSCVFFHACIWGEMKENPKHFVPIGVSHSFLKAQRDFYWSRDAVSWRREGIRPRHCFTQKDLGRSERLLSVVTKWSLTTSKLETSVQCDGFQSHPLLQIQEGSVPILGASWQIHWVWELESSRRTSVLTSNHHLFPFFSFLFLVLRNWDKIK